MRQVCIALLCVITGVAGVGVSAAAAATDSPKIAVINLSTVFDGYRLTKDLERKFDERRRIMAGEAEKRRAEIDVRREALGSFKPGTADYKSRRDELTELEMQYQVWASVKDQQLRESHKEWLLKIYTDIRAAIEAVAKEQGIDLVLTYEEVTGEAPDSKTLRQQLLLEKVIYFGEKLDLTRTVIDKVNRSYPGPESIQISAVTPDSRDNPRPGKQVADAEP